MGISAPPITYSVDDKQYISLLVGYGGGGVVSGSLSAQHGWKYGVHARRMFTFALDGRVPIPSNMAAAYATPIDIPNFQIDQELADYGQELYAGYCLLCHGSGLTSGGGAPDLRESPIAMSSETFKLVVVEGEKRSAGMPHFPDFEKREIDGLMHYIRRVARETVGKPIYRLD